MLELIKIDIRNESEQIKRIFSNKDLVSLEDLFAKIEELDDDIARLEDEKRELEQDIQDNYKPISVEEQYCVSDKDFV